MAWKLSHSIYHKWVKWRRGCHVLTQRFTVRSHQKLSAAESGSIFTGGTTLACSACDMSFAGQTSKEVCE